MTKTAKETAKEIRQTLKTLGWNARKVSVRFAHTGFDSKISVTVKDASVPIARVREVAEAHRSIDRCEATGEILLGGNLYVDVAYSDAAIAPFRSGVLCQLEAECVEPGVIAQLDGGIAAWRAKDEPEYFVLVHDDWAHRREVWGAKNAAQTVAEIALGGGVVR